MQILRSIKQHLIQLDFVIALIFGSVLDGCKEEVEKFPATLLTQAVGSGS
jgi:hypothetical protein